MKTLLIVLCIAVATSAAPQTRGSFSRGLSRIIGGEDAAPGDIPYIVSFQDISFGYNFHFCGGTIYSASWVITAGQCLEGADFNNPSYLQVVAGESRLSQSEGTEQTIILKKIIQHEEYDHFTYLNDIALLQLSVPFEMNSMVQALPIADSGEVASGDCLTGGWGTTTEGGSASSILQSVTLPIVTQEDCRSFYGAEEIFDTMMCAGDVAGGKSFCQGDNGGPLICKRSDGTNYLAGIASWLYGCARENYPGVFTDVSYYVDWINRNTRIIMKVLILCLLVASAIAAPSTLPRWRRGHNRIVGGTDARPGELPYQLSFQDTSFGANFHFCGASVYTTTVMICAAHCVDGENYDNPKNLRIVAGEHDLSKDEGTEQARDVTKIIMHENYDSSTTTNDISLLFVGTPLIFNSYVDGVTLPASGQSFSGNALVSGWGTLSSGGSTPDILQKVTVPIVSDASCRASYSVSQIADSMMCAGEEGKDSCQGDSGGPLACGSYLCGIVSWGRGCALAGYPGVYTEVSYFVDWIANNS
ncbi:transmembrane protease serine 9 [Hyalella azteca]|uniref:Transmembrane protease serine 9 n=1 Tax=Hyalella azteca TaxID=294128 RepID=A0A979FLI0_HYAAZ|nr:transmembrane protease serine 9 [Hyalella azteca]